jgi:arylsulfatase A-like enzyme
MPSPNILFLLSDEHSFRFFSHLSMEEGGEPVETPHLDRLKNQSVKFNQTYCQMALCTPSRLCLLSGKHVRGAGAWSNDSTLAPDLVTLPAALRGVGYETCLVGKMHLALMETLPEEPVIKARNHPQVMSETSSPGAMTVPDPLITRKVPCRNK